MEVNVDYKTTNKILILRIYIYFRKIDLFFNLLMNHFGILLYKGLKWRLKQWKERVQQYGSELLAFSFWLLRIPWSRPRFVRFNSWKCLKIH